MKLVKKITIIFIVTLLFIGTIFVTIYFKNGFNDKSSIINDYPVTINGIFIDSKPERICSLSPGITDSIYNFNQQNPAIFCGISDYCIDYTQSLTISTDNVVNSELNNRDDQTDEKTLPRIGSSDNPNLTKIKELAPDVVILYGKIPQSIKFQLGKSTKIIEIMPPKNFDEFLNIEKNLILLLNGAIKGESNFNNYKEKTLASFENISSKISEKSILMLPAINKAITGDTFFGNLLTELKANNICHDNTNYELKIPEQLYPIETSKSDEVIESIGDEIKKIPIDFIIIDKSISENDISEYLTENSIECVKLLYFDFTIIEKIGFNIIEEFAAIL